MSTRQAGSPYPIAQSTGSSSSFQNAIENVRVRFQPSDLNVGRDSDQFSGLQAASLAVSQDDVSKKGSFDVHLTIGYALPSFYFGQTLMQSIPFIKYDRDYVDGSKIPPDSNVHNLAVGIQEHAVFRPWGEFYNDFLFQPEYIFSLKRDAQVFKLHFSDQPEPLVPVLGSAWPLGWQSLAATGFIRPTLNIGTIIRSAGEPNLAAKSSFTQGGIDVGLSLFDTTDGTFLNGLSIPVEYVYLHGFSGQYRTVQEVTAGVNYTFPKTKYISIGFSYTNGRNVDTFESDHLYKLSLGLKY